MKPFFSCSQKEKCNFFQWGDKPLRQDNLKLLNDYNEFKKYNQMIKEEMAEKF